MPKYSILSRLLVASMCSLWCGLAGCNSGQPSPNARAASASGASQVKAQGQILPKSGIVRIAATPGDIVASIEVEVGDEVEQGCELIVLKSAALRQKQRAALEAQRAAAEEERSQALLQAQQQLRIAQEKLSSVQAREETLGKQRGMLELAGEQLAASKRLLSKLEGIAANELTGEFVGDLEVDRQRMSVGEANLKYQQRQAEFSQAEQDLKFARRAAEMELELAEESLEAIAASSALAVYDAQLATLDEEIAASKVIAPLNGTILAINTKQGEAAAQFPLIEMADLNHMVCEVEVNEIDAGRVAIGDPATVTSRAFEKALPGKVVSKSALIGRPTLRPVDPLARSDFRTVTTVIALEDASVAEDWLQLHVQAEIEVDGQATSAEASARTAAQPDEATANASEDSEQ